MILSIIICTYRRVDIVPECLDSIVPQLTDDVEIVIVDNGSLPDDHQRLQDITTSYDLGDQLRLIVENKTGLSYARNAGISATRGQWIALMDDDAQMMGDYVDRSFGHIAEERFDCFGGGIESWWRTERPRWLSENHGSKPILADRVISLSDDYLWGSNIIMRRDAALAVGGFPTEIGMSGSRIGYAAENVIQDKLRSQGYSIGYDPDLRVRHLVAPEKHRIHWHIRATYATGRDGIHAFADQYGMRGMIGSLRSALIAPLVSFSKWTANKEYYWENLVLDSIKPWSLLLGKLRAIIAS